MGIKLSLCSLAVVLTAHAQTVTATATPNPVNFNYVSGGVIPSPVNVALKAGSLTSAYTTIVTPPGTLWVTVTPDTGKLPGTLSIRVNPTSLPQGPQQAVITVSASGMVNLNIAVTLNITAPLPSLTINPTTINLIYPASPPVIPIPGAALLSTTGTPVTFTAAISGAPWLTVSPTTGVVLPGEQFQLNIAADPSSLVPQSKAYSGKITVVASGVPTANKTQTITVNLSVNPLTPVMTTIWPSTVQANAGPATLTIFGSGFYAGTTVKAGTTPLTTPAPVIVSGTQIQAVVPASMLVTPGSIVSIVVSNPAPGGDCLTPQTLTVSSTPVVQAILNAASYTGTSVAPGEIVALFGTAIGPPVPTLINVTNGFVDTSLGTLLVTIGGQPAPILYADPNQITVQVPYEVIPGPIPQAISVTPSQASGSVVVGTISPGIFTADGSGIGQAAAIVQSSTTNAVSLNSATSPAHAGDWISLYLTGEGDWLTAPRLHTGYVVPAPVPPAQLPSIPAASPSVPTVTVGGVTAPVLYAGAIPGSIIGLLQINFTVPPGVTPGSAQVVVTIGSMTTQSNVTVFIK